MYLCQRITGGFLVAFKDDQDQTIELIFNKTEFDKTINLFNAAKVLE